MKVMTFNAGIWTRNWKKTDPFYWKPRMEAMKEMITDNDPDVICFQELWFPMNRYIPKNYRKVCGTGVEHPIYVKRSIPVGKRMFRIFWSMAEINGINVFCVHGHWNKKVSNYIYNQLLNQYAKHSYCVFTGDFNMEYDYIPGHMGMSARLTLGREKKDTYIHFHDSSRHGELDHILLNGCRPYYYGVIPDKTIRISDHYPVIAIIDKTAI